MWKGDNIDDILFSSSSSLCVNYKVVPSSANLPLMRMNILILTRNQLQEIVLLFCLHTCHIIIFSVMHLYYGVFSNGVYRV